MAKKLDNKKVLIIKLSIILSVIVLLGISLLFSSAIEKFLGIGSKVSSFKSAGDLEQSDLQVHYIDVGQGDSTLIKLPDGTTMLIDAGTSESQNSLVKYIKNQGISVIDYFVLTHSDADHVGGASKILSEFEVKNIYRPFQIAVTSQKIPIEDEELKDYAASLNGNISLISTKTYQEFISNVYKETYAVGENFVESNIFVSYDNLTIRSTKDEVSFQFEFFAPLKLEGQNPIEETIGKRTKGYPTKYYKSDTNNASSPFILLEYKESSFLFTGDAPDTVEKDVISSLTDFEKSRFRELDVFQAGHHGSTTSNCTELLELIKPTYVVVSCGLNNKYKHPTEEFLERVNSLPHHVNDYLVRTDLMGSITFGYSDGSLAYTAVKAGEGVTIYWWQIATGIFVVALIVVLSVKITSNKTATAKRIKSKTEKVVKSIKK